MKKNSAFDLICMIIDNPDFADKIADNSMIEFVEKDFKSKKRYPRNSKLIKVKNEIEIINRHTTAQYKK
ncbi:MAG: hypothetical protein WHT29_00390 [Bacteroidales bacterium]